MIEKHWCQAFCWCSEKCPSIFCDEGKGGQSNDGPLQQPTVISSGAPGRTPGVELRGGPQGSRAADLQTVVYFW